MRYKKVRKSGDDLASIKKNAQTNLDTVKDPESLKEFKSRRDDSDIFKSMKKLNKELKSLMKNNASTKDEIKAKTTALNDVLSKAKKLDEVLIKAFEVIETVNKLNDNFAIEHGENFAEVNKAIRDIKNNLITYIDFLNSDDNNDVTIIENKIKELQNKTDAIPQLKANSCANAKAQADALKTEAEKLGDEAKDKNVEEFSTIKKELGKITGTSANEVSIAQLKFYYDKCDDKDINTLKDLYDINDSLKTAIDNFKTLVKQLYEVVSKAKILIDKTNNLTTNENKNKANYVNEQYYEKLLNLIFQDGNKLESFIDTRIFSVINDIRDKSNQLEEKLKEIDSLLTKETKNKAIEAVKEDGIFDKLIKETKKLYIDNNDKDKFKDPSKVQITIDGFVQKIDVAKYALEAISKNNNLNNETEDKVNDLYLDLTMAMNELEQAKIIFQSALKN